jgi:SepF-like predicted cell division protein (DUF552 family)
MAFNRMKKFFSGDETNQNGELPEEGYVEVNVMDSMVSSESGASGSAASQSIGRLGIKIEKLNDFAETDRILRHVREGSIVFLRIKGLKEKDMGELKRAVEKMKKTVVANNGDIVGVEQDWLILTPGYAAINR